MVAQTADELNAMYNTNSQVKVDPPNVKVFIVSSYSRPTYQSLHLNRVE